MLFQKAVRFVIFLLLLDFYVLQCSCQSSNTGGSITAATSQKHVVPDSSSANDASMGLIQPTATTAQSLKLTSQEISSEDSMHQTFTAPSLDVMQSAFIKSLVVVVTESSSFSNEELVSATSIPPVSSSTEDVLQFAFTSSLEPSVEDLLLPFTTFSDDLEPTTTHIPVPSDSTAANSQLPSSMAMSSFHSTIPSSMAMSSFHSTRVAEKPTSSKTFAISPSIDVLFSDSTSSANLFEDPIQSTPINSIQVLPMISNSAEDFRISTAFPASEDLLQPMLTVEIFVDSSSFFTDGPTTTITQSSSDSTTSTLEPTATSITSSSDSTLSTNIKPTVTTLTEGTVQPTSMESSQQASQFVLFSSSVPASISMVIASSSQAAPASDLPSLLPTTFVNTISSLAVNNEMEPATSILASPIAAAITRMTFINKPITSNTAPMSASTRDTELASLFAVTHTVSMSASTSTDTVSMFTTAFTTTTEVVPTPVISSRVMMLTSVNMPTRSESEFESTLVDALTNAMELAPMPTNIPTTSRELVLTTAIPGSIAPTRSTATLTLPPVPSRTSSPSPSSTPPLTTSTLPPLSPSPPSSTLFLSTTTALVPFPSPSSPFPPSSSTPPLPTATTFSPLPSPSPSSSPSPSPSPSPPSPSPSPSPSPPPPIPSLPPTTTTTTTTTNNNNNDPKGGPTSTSTSSTSSSSSSSSSSTPTPSITTASLQPSPSPAPQSNCPSGLVLSPCPFQLKGCVPATYICNGRMECTSGEDETGCPTNGSPIFCPLGTVICRDLNMTFVPPPCISTEQHCDGITDCPDGSDEAFCPSGEVPSAMCPSGMIPSPCINDTSCFRGGRVCNNINNCPTMGSVSNDERFCNDRHRCPFGMTPCRRIVSQCVFTEVICNGINDCFDSSDEEFCNPDACRPGFVISPCDQDIPGCVETAWICDGQNQCPLGEDEMLCSSPGNFCDSQSIPCRITKTCVSALLVCNGVMGDCSDNTDEFFCGSFQCPSGFVNSPCRNSVPGCFAENRICNLVTDCMSRIDEQNCDLGLEVDFAGFGTALGDIFFEGIDDITFMLDRLPNPVLFFGFPESDVFISTNGIITFRTTVPRDRAPMAFPTSARIPIIAVFWADLSFGPMEGVYARVLTGSELLADFGYSDDDFVPNVGIDVTWFRPSLFNVQNGDEFIAFQAVILSNGIATYTVFKYANPDLINQLPNRVVGFDAGDGVRASTVLFLNANSTSLVHENAFRIDGHCITKAEPESSCGLDAFADVCEPETLSVISCICFIPGKVYDYSTRKCVDADCRDPRMPCAVNAVCANITGSYECICNRTGFEGDGFAFCADVNECEENACDQTCTNTAGSFECSCSEGFILGEDIRQCEDIDECLFNPCTSNAECINTEGSFTCVCNSFYMGDGNTCAVSNVAISVSAAIGVVLLIVAVVVIVAVAFCVKYRRKMSLSVEDRSQIPPMNLELLARRNALGNDYFNSLRDHTVRSSFRLDLPKSLIINSCNLQIGMTIGQGEFGIVYKGLLKKGFSEGYTESVAVKTLKGFMQDDLVKDLLKECVKMHSFDHPNVLRLMGVCLDGGPAPYIIMPFMANGSLHSYLKQERENLVLDSSHADDLQDVQNKLTDMCIQVAKGMEYLASKRVIHRDLASRNCMIDVSFVIKVADFGLSESIDSTKDYFRQDQESTVKLPIKWLAPESITDGVFSEKSDVWAYGVTCWEVFSGGKTPYPGIHPLELSHQLEMGYRMEKPYNAACPEEMYRLMKSCWESKADLRPTFTQLLTRLSSLLESMADYLDFFTLSNPHGSDNSLLRSPTPGPKITSSTPPDEVPIPSPEYLPQGSISSSPIRNSVPKIIEESLHENVSPPCQPPKVPPRAFPDKLSPLRSYMTAKKSAAELKRHSVGPILHSTEQRCTL